MGKGPTPRQLWASLGWMLLVEALLFLPAITGEGLLSVLTGAGLAFTLLAAALARFFGRGERTRQVLIALGIQACAIALVMLGFVPSGSRLSIFGALLAVAVVTQFGALLVEEYRERRVARLWASKQVSLTYTGRSRIGRSLESRSRAYVGIPLGFLTGMLLSETPGLSELQREVVPLQVTLLVTSCFLTLEVIRNAVQMMDPLWDAADANTPSIVALMRRLSGRRDQVIVVLEEGRRNKSPAEVVQGVAVGVCEVRKTYLWSSVYAVTVLFGLVLAFFQISATTLPSAGLVVGSLAVLFALVQVPYVLGQAFSRDALLDGFEGTEKEELREKLSKYAPVFPKFEALGALTATGTAGGFLYLVLERFAKGALGLGQ